jgi:hypothetical protein
LGHPDDLQKAAARSSEVGAQMTDKVKWIRTYVIAEDGGRVGTMCIYQGVDEAAIREHAQRADLPCDAVLPIADTVVINDDPTAA